MIKPRPYREKTNKLRKKTNKQSGEYKRCIEREKKSQKEVL